jgi:hypothetical protein
MSYFINPVGKDRCVFPSYEGGMPAVELSAARYEAAAVPDQRRWHRLAQDRRPAFRHGNFQLPAIDQDPPPFSPTADARSGSSLRQRAVPHADVHGCTPACGGPHPNLSLCPIFGEIIELARLVPFV